MQLFTFFTRPTSGLKSIILVLGVLLGVKGVMGQTTVTLTTGSSWTVPANVTSVKVECWGGGGSGGGVNGNGTNRGAAGGGAGGAYARINSLSVTPGNNITYSIGSGGTASGTTGNTGPGGDTWFSSNSIILAKGGVGALTIAPTAVSGTPLSGTGASGTSNGSIGDQVYAGGNGGNGVAANSGTSNSGGGGSSAGTSSNGNNASGLTAGTAPTGGYAGANGKNAGSTSTGNGNAATASNYGAAGGGASATASNSLRTGGAGAQGVIILTYTVNTTPTISTTGTLAAVNTTYGSASATPTSFTVSGTNMTGGILVTPPSSNFEVSTTVGSGYADNITVGAAGTIASTTVYLRLKPTATVSGSPYAGNIVLSSSGATSVNVATVSSTVSPKALTITGLTGNNKVYDATTTASATGTAAYSGLVNGDNPAVAGTPVFSFTTKTKADGKPITVTGFTAPTANYTVSQPTGLTGNITAASLSVTGASGTNKTYDASNAASITDGVLSGVISPDVVNLVNGVGTFSQATIGDGLTVTPNFSITGADAANYSLSQPTGLTANITPKNLTITGLTANNKAFDGNDAATLSGTASLVGVETNDNGNVTLGGTPVATFASSAVGDGIAVTVIGYTISGSASGNYTLSQPTGLTANITSVSTPVINSSLTLSATYGLAIATYTITATNNPTSFNATGLPAGLSLNTSTGAITGTPTANVGSYNVAITATNAGGTSSPAETLVITIGAKALTIANISVANKSYTGTNAATITGTPTFSGLATGDNFTPSGGSATFNSVNVADGIAITVTGYTAPNANYSLTQPTGITANITPAALTITANNISNKVYGTALTGGSGSTAFTNSALQNGETLSSVTITYGTGAAANDAVATYNSSITPSAAVGGNGFNTANYNITYTAGNLTVTAKPLTITGLTANGKTYDGTNTVSVTGTPSYDGLIAGESFTVSGTPTFAFTTVSAGLSKAITQTGNYSVPSGNYTLTQPTLTANIAQAPLTITAAAQSKNFGTTSPTTGATAFTSSGLIIGETIGSVTLAYSGSPAGNLATALAGTYTITPSAATGGSFTAANYSITYNTGQLTINAIQASAPTGIVITPGNGQLSVAFTAASNGGSAITNYKYSTDNGATFTAVSPAQTTSPIVITGLTNGTQYQVQIRAVTAFGDGEATGSTAGTPALTNATTILWSSANGSAWLTASNWTGSPSAVPIGTQVAQFGANPTAATGVGINFNGTTNAGTQTNGQKIQEVGAVELTSARAANHIIGNSTTTAGATGQFRLNAAVVNGIANTVIRNNSSQNLTIQNTQNTGTQTMTVILGGSTNNVINVDGSGNIVLASTIQSAAGPLTISGAGAGRVEITGASNTLATTGNRINITGAEVRFQADGSFGAVPGSVVANYITINGGRLSTVSATTYTLNANRGIQVGATAGTSISVVTSGTLTYNGIISNLPSNTGILVKQGAGTLALGGVNTYTGLTSINNGTLQLTTGNDRLPTSTIINLGQAASTNLGTFDLNGRNQTIAGLASTSGTAITGNNIVTSSTAATLTISGASSNTFGSTSAANPGIISGAVSIIKSGAGTQTFGGGANYTYSGTTTISGGTLQLGNANVIPATQVILNGGTFSTGATTGFSETVGTLNLQTTGTIALGSGVHTLTFAASNGVTWAGSTLTIIGWTGNAGASGTNGKIFFGVGGLSSIQLGKINFDGYNAGAALLGTGELVPINPPQITGAATTAVFTSTYGSNSSIQEFAIDGVNLIAHIYVTAPSNFEVATDGRTFSSSAEFIPSNGIVNGTLSVRLAATAAIDGAYNSQNIVLSSTGATTVNITTPTSGNGVRPTTLVVTGSTVCSSATGSVTSDGSLPGVSYQLYTAAGTPIQSPQSDLNGAAITWTGLTSGVSYYVVGTSPASSSSLTSANSNFAEVAVATGYTWTGNAGDNDQTNSANWQCGAVPDNNAPPVSVTVNGFLLVTGSDFQAADLIIASGASVLLADGKLKISGSLGGDNGAIDATAGTVVFNKFNSNVIPGNVFYNNTIHNLQIEGDASFDGAINLTGELSIVGNNIELNADESLTLISNETGTARIADLTAGGTQTGNSVTGIVNAQRYIPLNTLGASRSGRAWRLMSIPLEGNSALNTVRLAFAGTAPNPNASAEESNGIGTLISGPGSLNTSGAAAAARGFDYWNGLNTGTASSIRRFTTTSTGAGWTETPLDIHTTSLDNAEQAYMLFIRGDRGIRNVNDPLQTQPASATQFQTVGTLKQGNKTVTIPSLSTATAFAVLGNPYFAPLNFESVGNDGDNNGIIKPNQFYLWDANLPGTNGNGGYRLITKLIDGVWEDASDATFTGNNPDLELIQPWQAIIVIPDAGGTLTIKEQHKQGNPGSAPQPFDPIVAAPQPWLRAGLYYNEAKASSRIDGTAVAFGVNDTLQVAAINPFGSSLSINMRKAGNTLKAEKRGFFQTTDTVHFVTNGLTARKFVLQLQADALVQPGGTVELVDKYTNTRTTLVPGTTTDYVFTPVAGNAASMAADRLMVVLRQPVFVPATFVNVSARTTNNGHLINWTTTNEQHIQRYEVEYSSNGTQFAKLENKNALKGNTNNYQHTVANPAVADAYYRIKAIGYNGDVQYSNRVWLKETSITGSEVKLYPNPVKGQQVNIELSRLAQGNYQIVLVNAVGQQVMSRIVSHIGGTATQTLPTGSLSAGLYELQVYQNDTLVARQKMSVAVGK